MKPEFIALTADAMDEAFGQVLEMMGCLYAESGGAYRRERARHAAEVLAGNPELGGIWLIDVGGETAGYLCLTLCFSLEFDGRFALLDELYVKEAWRGQRLGAEAIAFAEQWSRARGLTAIRLEVERTNLRALDLYRRRDFTAHDRHLMTKWL
jgi:GNAT superfamily N-acetyltransferase